MSTPPDETPRADTLRQRAETYLRQSPQDIANMPVEDVQRLVHELQVHQIELEMQNAELQRAYLDLEAMRDRYTHLYLHAPVGYVTLDADGTILEANLATAGLLGVARTELLSTRLARFVVWDDQGEFLFHRQEVLAADTPLITEFSLRLQDESVRHVRAESVAVQDEAAGEKRCRMALVDITNRIHAEQALMRAHTELEQRVQERTEALRRAERLAFLGQLSAGVAHEIRNPLHTILLNLDLVKEDLKQVAPEVRTQIEAALADVETEAVRMNDVVQNYLTLARRGSIKRQAVDLGLLLKEIAEGMRERLQNHGITLRLEGLGRLGQVLLHSSTFRRAILNLMQNAMEAMPSGGSLTLHGRRTPASVSLEVSDTGSGIPLDQLPHIFDPLQTTKAGGTGLGLHVVREIVAMHDGQITVQSDVGRGTTFTITLPPAAAEESSQT
jgi:PAS domain S-box-containing protein